MKILLIQPPIRDFYRTSIRTQPIGLAYLAAALKLHSHDVEILDCQTESKRSIAVPSELSYLRDFYPFNDRSPFKLYTGYYHFGMEWDEIRKRIENSKVDIFGISSSFTPYHGEALEIARIIKEWDPQKIVAMGGAHVSCDPENVLSSLHVDYAVLGEGEIRFPLLLEEIEKGGKGRAEEVDGVGYRRNGEIRINPLRTFIRDLDGLQHPARDLLDPDRYRIKRRRSTMILTSRGCPHGCAYCSAHRVMGTEFRVRSPEAVVEEMLECRNHFGIDIFDFEDDNLTFDRLRAKNLLNLIIGTFGEKNIELSAMNGISFASLDGELLELMKKAGFLTINLSFVSTDLSTKERMGRPRETSGFDTILEGAERAHLSVIAYAILGMPGQSIGEMVDTLTYLMERRVLIGPSIYYPTSGTLLFERCKRDGLLPPGPSQWRSSAFPIQTKDFNRLDLVTLFRLARAINFVKGKMDEGELEEGITWRELGQFVGKVKVEIEDNDVVEIKRYAPCAMRYAKAGWLSLLRMVIEERSFFSLRKGPGGEMAVSKVETSKKVLGYFFEKAWEKPILKSVMGR